MAIQGQQFVDYLKKFLGTPYVWGGNSLTKGVDCSGLVQQGLKHFGINISRTTYTQIKEGKAVGTYGDLRVGDLVFFNTDPSDASVDHVGVYIGDGKMIHAPRTGDVVKIASINNSYWSKKFMGGRRVAGVIGGGKGSDNTATLAPEEKSLSPEELASEYGWSYGFLQHNPELKKLFGEAVKDSWSAQKFQAKVRDTDFWKKNSETARNIKILQDTDPATYRATLDAAKLQLQQVAAKIGAAVPKGKLEKMAKQALLNGLDENGMRQVLAGYIDFTQKGGVVGGEAGMHTYVMRQYAADMGVDIDDQTARKFAVQIIKGLSTTQDYENFIKESAKSSFPSFADQIDAGDSMHDIANPYMQMMADTLEINPGQVNLKDPLIKDALNGLNQDGYPSGLSLTDFQDRLRGDPRWKGTQQAVDRTASIATSVLKNMGLI